MINPSTLVDRPKDLSFVIQDHSYESTKKKTSFSPKSRHLEL